MTDRKELIERLAELRQFLDGSGPIGDHYFGDRIPESGRYWWRQFLPRIDEAIAALSDQWISVSERIPKDGDHVLVFQNHDDHSTMGAYFWDRWWKMNFVTHWQPLPAPPED